MYPLEDGWYSLDEDGNEVRLENFVIVNQNNTPYEQKPLLHFKHPLTVAIEEERMVVGFGAEEEDEDEDGENGYAFMHDNEFHTEDYITDSDLTEHANTTSGTHGIDDIWDAVGALQGTGIGIRSVLKTSDAETSVVASIKAYIGDTTGNHTEFILPSASTSKGLDFLFRRSGGSYALVVHRTGEDVIDVDGNEWTGIEMDSDGWVAVHSDGEKWYLTKDSGNYQEAT